MTNESDQLQQLVEQLYENEALTSALSDESAKILLTWGEQQLQDGSESSMEYLEETLAQVQQVMRTINRLVEQQVDLNETELVERLLKLVEQSNQLTLQKSGQSQATEGEKEDA